jgi:hypothetical protein
MTTLISERVPQMISRWKIISRWKAVNFLRTQGITYFNTPHFIQLVNEEVRNTPFLNKNR